PGNTLVDLTVGIQLVKGTIPGHDHLRCHVAGPEIHAVGAEVDAVVREGRDDTAAVGHQQGRLGRTHVRTARVAAAAQVLAVGAEVEAATRKGGQHPTGIGDHRHHTLRTGVYRDGPAPAVQILAVRAEGDQVVAEGRQHAAAIRHHRHHRAAEVPAAANQV